MLPKLLPKLKVVEEYLAISQDSPSGLIWIKRPKQSRIKVNDFAGRLHHAGYWQVKFQGKLYLTHRIVYLLKTGVDPGLCPIDHPMNRDDNINTRLATYSQNNYNRPKQKTFKGLQTTSQYKGVCFDKKSGKWQASICYKRKNIYLGQFAEEQEAAVAYNNAAKKYFKEFALLNQIELWARLLTWIV